MGLVSSRISGSNWSGETGERKRVFPINGNHLCLEAGAMRGLHRKREAVWLKGREMGQNRHQSVGGV